MEPSSWPVPYLPARKLAGRVGSRSMETPIRSALSRSALFRSALFRSALFRSALFRSALSRSALFRSALSRSALFRSALSRSALFRSALFRSALSKGTAFRPSANATKIFAALAAEGPRCDLIGVSLRSGQFVNGRHILDQQSRTVKLRDVLLAKSRQRTSNRFP
jgi:hypothetical protein